MVQSYVMTCISACVYAKALVPRGSIALVGRSDALAQSDRRLPAQGLHPLYVEELSRRAVGLRCVPFEGALVADDIGDKARELGDRHVLAHSDVDVLSLVVDVEQAQAGSREIIELSPGP